MSVVVIMVMMMINRNSYYNLEVSQSWRLYLSLVFIWLAIETGPNNNIDLRPLRCAATLSHA